MNIVCVIPSRLASTRLANKALLPIQGKPMIQWTFENAKRCQLLQEVIVATDSKEIAEIITKINGKIVMTASDIPNGSTRVAVVAEQYPDADVIINLQGDEPFIKPKMLEQLVAPYLAGETPHMTTLAYPLSQERYFAQGAVKVITDKHNNALYFSRSPIPFNRDVACTPVYNHMGLYAFTRDFLMLYKNLSPTALEKAESLEQLRVLEHGYKIRVCLTEEKTLEVNTAEEYQQAQSFQYSVE